MQEKEKSIGLSEDPILQQRPAIDPELEKVLGEIGLLQEKYINFVAHEELDLESLLLLTEEELENAGFKLGPRKKLLSKIAELKKLRSGASSLKRSRDSEAPPKASAPVKKLKLTSDPNRTVPAQRVYITPQDVLSRYREVEKKRIEEERRIKQEQEKEREERRKQKEKEEEEKRRKEEEKRRKEEEKRRRRREIEEKEREERRKQREQEERRKRREEEERKRKEAEERRAKREEERKQRKAELLRREREKREREKERQEREKRDREKERKRDATKEPKEKEKITPALPPTHTTTLSRRTVVREPAVEVPAETSRVLTLQFPPGFIDSIPPDQEGMYSRKDLLAQKLFKEFSQYGWVANVHLVKGTDYGLVDMQDVPSAVAAYRGLYGRLFGNSQIEIAFGKERAATRSFTQRRVLQSSTS